MTAPIAKAEREAGWADSAELRRCTLWAVAGAALPRETIGATNAGAEKPMAAAAQNEAMVVGAILIVGDF